MFDLTGEPLAVRTADLAGLIEQNHAELMAAECRMLQLACAWADAHYLDSGSDEYQPLIQRACAWGGEGTPEVSEYCAAELGALQGTGMVAARSLIADALDLRYRLPRLWGRVLTGGVRAWQARKIAEQTRCLSWQACADVDHALSDFVGMMPWPRFAKILSATILEANPALAAERAERARSTQDVFSFDSEDGLKTVVAKAAAGDAVWFVATVNRIAEILAACGDTNPVGVRRARALGILAQPAEALRLLIEHQHDRSVQPSEPAEPESVEPHTTSPDEPEESSEDEPEAEPVPDADADDHRSLSMGVPPAFDARAARPRVVLHFHLSDAALRTGHALVRPEDGGPLILEQLVELLGRTGCQVRIQPVLDPAETAPVDGYEIPQRLRAAVRARQIADVFPFGTCISSQMDLDHTERYVPTDYGGPPGQTRLGNLGPMARPGHRAETHGGWAKRQPEPGYFMHRSPNGYVYLVTNQGTLALGRTTFSATVWQAATPKPAAIPA
ncbi:MAG TPA: hypothetical protein VI094_20325 [Propionibacteriaceae bacterium]